MLFRLAPESFWYVPHNFLRASLLSESRYLGSFCTFPITALKSAIFLRHSSSFCWRVVFTSQDPGTNMPVVTEVCGFLALGDVHTVIWGSYWSLHSTSQYQVLSWLPLFYIYVFFLQQWEIWLLGLSVYLLIFSVLQYMENSFRITNQCHCRNKPLSRVQRLFVVLFVFILRVDTQDTVSRSGLGLFFHSPS